MLRETVARNQDISKKYIHNIFTILKNNGLVTAVRGKKGGYLLAKPPSEISLDKIIEILEGPVLIVDCVGNRKACKRSAKCRTINLWEDLGHLIKDFLASMTLEDFVVKNANLPSEHQIEYMI
jgi:Rrf2 family transcriptional regulator, cysteine metabolism repressor